MATAARSAARVGRVILETPVRVSFRGAKYAAVSARSHWRMLSWLVVVTWTGVICLGAMLERAFVIGAPSSGVSVASEWDSRLEDDVTLAMQSTRHACGLWARVLARVAVDHWQTVAPLLRRAFLAFVQQDALSLAVEAGVVCAAVIIWLVQRHVRSARYVERLSAVVSCRLVAPVRARGRAVQGWVAHKSRVLGAVFPHAMYALCVSLIAFLLPAWVLASVLDSRPLLWVVAVAWPVFRTWCAVERRDEAAVCVWVERWVAMGLLVAIDTIQEDYLGLAAFAGRWHALVRWAIVWWLLLPVTAGAQVALCALQPLITRIIGRPDARDAEAGVLYTLLRVLDLLSLLRVCRPATVAALRRTLAHSGWLIVSSLVFLVTPGFVTRLGVLWAGVAIPAWASLRARAQHGRSRDAPELIMEWAVYWAAFFASHSAVETAATVLSVLPLWNHAHLVLVLALQMGLAQWLYQNFGRSLETGVHAVRSMTTPRPAHARPPPDVGRETPETPSVFPPAATDASTSSTLRRRPRPAATSSSQ